MPGFQWMLAGTSIVLLIAALVIFYHAFRATRNNPIQALNPT
jgi:ABC-type antimicrobial peptide transport system permease subunit